MICLSADLIASSGNSTIILFHLYGDDLGPDHSPEPADGLIGHHANVCALQYSRKHRKMISASWDCAARVWSRSKRLSGNDVPKKAKSKAGDWNCERVLSGHEAAVWGVAILDGGLYDGNYMTGKPLHSGFDSTVLHAKSSGLQSRFGRSDLENVRYRGDGYPDVRCLSRCNPIIIHLPRLSSNRFSTQ